MKILVTGGLGYIGSHTVYEVIRNGHQVVIIDNLSNTSKDVLGALNQLTGRELTFYEADILNMNHLTAIFENEGPIDGVIHFAAKKSVNESLEKPAYYYDNNVAGVINLMKMIDRFGLKYFVFSSSCTVYGQPEIIPVSEETQIVKSPTPYGNSKIIAEMILEEYTKLKPGLSTVMLRYFNPVGAHETALIGELPIGIPSNLMPFITQTAAGWREQLKVFGNDYDTRDGTAIRDYIHVVDLADAHVKAIEWMVPQNDVVEVFNIGTGNGHTVLEVVHSFEKTTGMKLNYALVERRAGDIEQIWADTTKSEQILGWKANRTLDDMTLSAWRWQERLSKPK